MVAKQANHVEVWMRFLKDGLMSGDPTVLGVFVALIVVLLTILIFLIKRRGNTRRGVLLLGCCNAGKTVLFSRLVHKKLKQTFTSMSPNSGMYSVPEKKTSLLLIDLPGHERIRTQILESYKDFARGIIFIVDSSSIQKDIKDIGEYLYTVLSDSKISSNAPPVLIACNKQDLTFSKGAKVIQNQLEKEMNTVRVTKSAALQDISSGNNNTYLGKRNKDFTFSDLKPIKVDFVECSAQGKSPEDDADLSQVEEWLLNIA